METSNSRPMAERAARQFAEAWSFPSRCAPLVRRTRPPRLRATPAAGRRVRRNVCRCFQSECRGKDLPAASPSGLADGLFVSRGHRLAPHEVTEDFFRARPFPRVLFLRNGTRLPPQLEPETCVFQGIEAPGRDRDNPC